MRLVLAAATMTLAGVQLVQVSTAAAGREARSAQARERPKARRANRPARFRIALFIRESPFQWDTTHPVAQGFFSVTRKECPFATVSETVCAAARKVEMGTVTWTTSLLFVGLWTSTFTVPSSLCGSSVTKTPG